MITTIRLRPIKLHLTVSNFKILDLCHYICYKKLDLCCLGLEFFVDLCYTKGNNIDRSEQHETKNV